MDDEIKVGDTIRHKSLGSMGQFDVKVLGIEPCDGDGEPGDHPAFRIKDPETGEDDTVCSRDFVKVSGKEDRA